MMGPCQFAFILAIFTTQLFFVPAHWTGDYEEEEVQNYVAQDEVDRFNDQLTIFGGEYGKSWMMFPDGDGISQVAMLNFTEGKSEEIVPMHKYNQNEIAALVNLYSYTKQVPNGERINLDYLDAYNYDSSKPTKIIIHGWKASTMSLMVRGIRDAYLDERDVNVIGVDWSYLADDFFYPNSVAATPQVGKFVASLIDMLVERKNARYKDFHIVGHSLGAHVAGFAGSNTKRKIGRITGLDPALPGFGVGPSGKLDPTDANFVDVIHTCSGVLGIKKVAGHVDFYPNGGSPSQPGCSAFLPTNRQACSHGRAYEFFAESIRRHKFKGVSCPTWADFKSNNCHNNYEYMGEYTSLRAKGVFYLKTNSRSPFGLGGGGVFY